MVQHGVDRSGAAGGSGTPASPITEEIINAKGDLLAGDAVDSIARLTVGANETRLVADSAQATGLKYVADTTNYAVAAKGDLLVGTAADTVAPLTVGADGTMPMARASEASGFIYANPFRKNIIINSAFNVWQRGTSFVSIADSTYSADRWIYSKGGTMVHDITRSTDVPTVAQAGRLFNFSMLVDCTTADAAIAAGDFCVVQQRVEGFNWATLAQRAVVLTFWVKATKTGIYCVSLSNSGSDRSYVAEYTISVTDTWEKKTVTFTASPSAGTWDYTTGVGVRLTFALAAGTTFHTTAGAWQTGNFIGTSNQVNGCDNAANNFRIAGVQLEPGSVATEFESLGIETETALCQRYYETTSGVSNCPRVGGVATGAGQAFWATISFAVRKRAVPTMAINGTWALASANTPTINAVAAEAYVIEVVSTGAGNVSAAPNSTDDTVTAVAEL